MNTRDLIEALPDETMVSVRFVRRMLADVAAGGQPDAQGPKMLTVKETAQRLGMSSTYCYDHSAEIGAIRYGRSIRFPVEVVEEYLRRMQRDR